MEFKITGQNAFELVEVTLNRNEVVKFQSGSMVYHSPKISITGKTSGGILGGLKKSMLGGESFFVGEATSFENTQTIALAPSGIGKLVLFELTGETIFLADGAYLASEKTIEIDIVRQKNLGAALLGGTGGFFHLKASGHGKMVVESFGDIKAIELHNEEIIIDNSHVLAWTDGLSYVVESSGGLVNSFKSGEGFVNRFSGTGKVYIQTRQLSNLAYKISKFIPSK